MVQVIPIYKLLLVFIPAAVVPVILYLWSSGWKTGSYALLRMVSQLLLIGYFLAFIFESDSGAVICSVLFLMITAAGWISLRTIPAKRKELFFDAMLSIGVGGGFVLIIVTQLVMELEVWFAPRVLIPLGGMIFSNSLNSISVGAERLYAELEGGKEFIAARNKAYAAALIPITNSLFAVGLVALPGMMTGQILSGVSPLIAARYQMLVMCMIYGAAGISTAIFFVRLKKRIVN